MEESHAAHTQRKPTHTYEYIFAYTGITVTRALDAGCQAWTSTLSRYEQREGGMEGFFCGCC